MADLHARLASAGVPALALRLERIDVAAKARADGANLEATARRVRYRWLTEVARKSAPAGSPPATRPTTRPRRCCTGFCAGRDCKGCAASPRGANWHPASACVRPLLQTTRAEIIAYLESTGSAVPRRFHQPRSRFHPQSHPPGTAAVFGRALQPAVATALARLAEQAEEVFRDEEAAAVDAIVQRPSCRARDMLVFDRCALAAAPRRLTRAALRLAWAREGWPLDAMGYDAWERLAGLVYGEAGRPRSSRPHPCAYTWPGVAVGR